ELTNELDTLNKTLKEQIDELSEKNETIQIELDEKTRLYKQVQDRLDKCQEECYQIRESLEGAHENITEVDLGAVQGRTAIQLEAQALNRANGQAGIVLVGAPL
ncbi:11460_t:CDS:2, partial [Diversispora eburnea]